MASGLSLGAGVIGTGGFFAWKGLSGSNDNPSDSAPSDSAPSDSAPPESFALAQPAEPQPSIVDTYQPRLERVYSAGIYQTVATKSVAVEVARSHTQRATVEARQDAIEIDLIFDDRIRRESEVVLLGERDGWLIGFCYRYLVELEFPTPDLIGDGFGAPEFAKRRLTLLGSTYPIKRWTDASAPNRNTEAAAWYRVYGDHDAALVYVPKPKTSHEHLGIDDPEGVVQRMLDNSSTIFGLDFVLMSPQTFKAMKKKLNEQSRQLDFAVIAAAIAVAALALGPLLGASAAGSVSMTAVEEVGRKLVAKALPVALKLGRDFVLQEDGFVASQLGEDVRVALLGVQHPTGDPDGHGLLHKFLAAVVEQREGEAQYVEFGSSRAGRVGQVFLPGSKMSLNAELLARGLTRLDLQDSSALLEFPELVDAALSAVEGKHNLAGRWAEEDLEYVAQLRALSRVVAG